jgi:hypothetical protein
MSRVADAVELLSVPERAVLVVVVAAPMAGVTRSDTVVPTGI